MRGGIKAQRGRFEKNIDIASLQVRWALFLEGEEEGSYVSEV